MLPTICNMNPRSLYNKKKEFHAFIENMNIDVAFISETWETEKETLDDIIQIENFKVISNVSQRTGRGGRPALVVNKEKFHYQNLTNTVIQVPWGVEAVWAVLTPKNCTHDSKIQKIVCCAIYVKPNSKKKSLLLDHISEAFNILSTRYSRGLHFVLAGDFNDLKIEPILSLSPRLHQIVQDYTSLSPPAILDPIVTTLSHLYQTPTCVDPLDPDDLASGKPSDHRIPVARPINIIENKCSRQERTIITRPLTEIGYQKFQNWLIDNKWPEVFEATSAHEKALNFQSLLASKVNEFFPQKILKLHSDDQPWINFKIKKLDRKRKRIYRRERRSKRWKQLDEEFKNEVKAAKRDFYKKSVSELKSKKPSQWFQCLKRLTSYDQFKTEQPVCEEISHLSDEDQAERIATQFASIQNEYDEIDETQIKLPEIDKSSVPQFSSSEVWFALSRINTNKSTVSDDIPAKLLKRFAAYFAEPLTDIYNTALLKGEYPDIYKFEVCTPVPKVYPTQKLSQLRNISGLLNFDKIFEKLIAQLIIKDMEAKLDQAQFGNRKGMGIQHYLVQLIHRILSVLDTNSKGDKNAVLATLIDWENAFPRQCHTLGVQSFLNNGVRPSLIPLLISYFKDRKMVVKWHGKRTAPKVIKGGGPQGATLGLLEYTSQSNHNADCVSPEDRFKFVDDLSILEVINLITVGIESHDFKLQVPNDVPEHNQMIPPENLKSQRWLKEIEEWTSNQKMVINSKKTKAMIFNFTDSEFSTRLTLKGENIDIIKHTKLLGTTVSDNLKWDLNTKELIRKANQRMELLRKAAGFTNSQQELKEIYILFIRSILEQSAVVWHSSISIEDKESLERIQKSAIRIILGNKYSSYKNALTKLNLETLDERREVLCLNFAKKCTKHNQLKHMFPLNDKTSEIKTRFKEKYKVQFANTERFQRSPIIYMQKLLNENEAKQKNF